MKSVRIPAKVARDIRQYLMLSDDKHLKPGLVRLINDLDAALRPKKFVVAAKKRVKAKKAERQDEWAQIREKVLARANGKCEFCENKSWSEFINLDCDHMFSGANRKTLQSVFTVWALCRSCHHAKTNNRPSAATWLGRFVGHCERHRYEAPNGEGYEHAASIAKARLDSLRIQGRAE